jgi:hypothetical protein
VVFSTFHFIEKVCNPHGWNSSYDAILICTEYQLPTFHSNVSGILFSICLTFGLNLTDCGVDKSSVGPLKCGSQLGAIDPVSLEPTLVMMNLNCVNAVENRKLNRNGRQYNQQQ